MVSLMVPEMDDAIAHYTRDWGFSLVEDSRHASGHRWVELAPAGGARLRLVEARDDAERAVVGHQMGERVAFFIDIVDFDAVLQQWQAKGIQIVEPPRREDYGKMAVVRDKYGNRWDAFDAGSKATP